ncbi:MAG: hypothetical protein HC831_13755 [Chloroflexia bacterium]|nr:hypothetical protein [Chloroflexia bacterium]
MNLLPQSRDDPSPNYSLITTKTNKHVKLIYDSMKKNYTQLNTILLFIIIMVVSLNLGAQEYQKQVFRIKFNSSADTKLKTMKIQKSADGIVRTGFESVDRMSEKYGASSIKRVFPYAGKFEAKHQKYGLHLWYEVVVDPNADVRLAKEDYSKLSDISHSELILKNGTRSKPQLSKTAC